MADIEKTIEIKSTGFRELQLELKATKNALAEVTDPEQFAALSAKAAELKDKMGDLNEEVAAFSGSKFEQVSGQLGKIGTSLANLDFERAAEQAQTFTQITKSISFSEVTAGIKNFGKTLLSLGKALLLNPIFLIAAVIAAIVYGIYQWLESTGKLQQIMDAFGKALEVVMGWIEDGIIWVREMVAKFDELGTGVKIVIGILAGPFVAAIYAVTKALEYFGVIDDVETQKLNKLNAEKIKAINEQKDAFVEAQQKKIKELQAESSAYDDELQFQKELLQAQGKNVEAIDAEILQSKKFYLEEQRKLLVEQVIAETNASLEIFRLKAQTSSFMKGILGVVEKQIADAGGIESYASKAVGSKEEFAELEKDLKKTNQDIQILEATTATNRKKNSEKKMTDDKKAADAAIAEAKREADAKFAILMQQIADEEAVYENYRVRQLSEQQLEMDELANRLSEELAMLSEDDALRLALQEEYEKNSAAIKQKYADEAIAKKKEEDDKLITRDKEFKDAQIKADEDLATAKLALAQGLIANLSGLVGKNEKLANALFLIDKALAIGSIITSTQKEIAGYWANPTWSLLPDGGLAIKTASSSAAKLRAGLSIATIAASSIGKFKNGGGGGSISSGGGGSMPSVQPTQMTPANSANPSFNLFGQNNNGNNLSATQNVNGNQSMVIQAVVSETDISQTTERLSKIKQMSEN